MYLTENTWVNSSSFDDQLSSPPFTTRKTGVTWRANAMHPQRGGLRVHDFNGVVATVSYRGRLSGILSAPHRNDVIRPPRFFQRV